MNPIIESQCSMFPLEPMRITTKRLELLKLIPPQNKNSVKDNSEKNKMNYLRKVLDPIIKYLSIRN